VLLIQCIDERIKRFRRRVSDIRFVIYLNDVKIDRKKTISDDDRY